MCKFVNAVLHHARPSCDLRTRQHIRRQLRCYEPRGAMSCGSPMPRGERIAKPAEWETPMRPVFALRAGAAVDDWVAELRAGRPEPAWDRFLDRYRRLIFSAIRHYAEDYDDVMDVFAQVCEALRANDLRRLRSYVDQPDHSARFSTWLVTV